MADSQFHPNEEGVEPFQLLDTFVSDGSEVSWGLEPSALATVVARVLVRRGWQDVDAERAVQGKNVRELWMILREPHQARGPRA